MAAWVLIRSIVFVVLVYVVPAGCARMLYQGFVMMGFGIDAATVGSKRN